MPEVKQKSFYKKRKWLQRLTYLGIVSVLVPYQMATGYLYYYNSWPAMGLDWQLGAVAFLHMAGAFAFLVFLVVHLYMITTGPTVFAHTRAMISGWEAVEDAEACQWEDRSAADRRAAAPVF